MDVVSEIARRLNQDLVATGTGLSASVAPANERSLQFLTETALRHGVVLPQPFAKAVAIRHEGRDQMLMHVFEGEGAADMLIDGLDQVQDIAAETARGLWPPCPAHNHMLQARWTGDHVGWFCPSDDQEIAALGALDRVSSAPG